MPPKDPPLDADGALRYARNLLGPNAFAIYNPSLSRPFRVGKEQWLFETTLGTGDSWAEALEEVHKFLYPRPEK